MKRTRQLLAVLSILAATTGCQQHDEPAFLAVPRGSEPHSNKAVSCATAMQGRDYCSAIDRGDVQVRYAYVPALRNETSLTLVDRGGPGASLFGPLWPNRLVDRLRKADPHTGLLLMEEPWVTTTPTVACAKAAGDWHLAFREGRELEALAAHVVTACELDAARSPWSWSGAGFRSAVTAVEHELGRRALRFAGASFAGVRLSYLDRRWDRVDLVSPLPSGIPLADYLSRRRRHLDRLVASCAGCLVAQPVDVAGRSLPVTGFDRVSAIVAAGYLGPQRAAQTLRRIASADSAADLELIGRLSDSTTGRIGTSDLSPAVLAIWSEQCRALTPGSVAPERDDYFTRYLSPCAFIPHAAEPARRVDAAQICLSLTEHDAVVPVSLSRRLQARSATTVQTFAGPHGSVRGLARCLR